MFSVLFAAACVGGITYGMYAVSLAIDIAAHNSPTTCIVLESSWTSDAAWQVHVRYRVPGYSSNYTGLLDNTDSNAQYTVGEIIPCYYSTHNPDHVLQTVHGVGGGLIFGLVVACLFALPIAAGIFYVLFRIITEHTKHS